MDGGTYGAAEHRVTMQIVSEVYPVYKLHANANRSFLRCRKVIKCLMKIVQTDALVDIEAIQR